MTPAATITDMNPHIRREDTEADPRLWSVKYRVHPKDPDLPFTFDRTVTINKLGMTRDIPYRYLDDIYGALSNLKDLYVVVKKGRQSRISEFLVNTTFYCCDMHRGITVLYILQDEQTGKKFCKRRIDEAVNYSPYLSDLITEGGKNHRGRKKAIDSLAIKKFLYSWFYMVHSTSDSASRSPSSDVVVFDEYDAHDMSNETSFRSTMDDSDLQALIYVSTPTLPDYGIDMKYKSTSMGVWTVSCPTCLDDFIMDSVYFFGDGVKKLKNRRFSDGALRVFICPHCGNEIKPWHKQERGRYVHQQPELLKERRYGFAISNLILPQISADKAWSQYRECLLEPGGRKTYVNEKLGEACIDEEASVHFTRDILKTECCKDDLGWVEAAFGTYIGVDWGKDTHVSVWKPTEKGIQLLNMFEFKHDPRPLENAKQVIKLLTRYKPTLLVCDFGAGQEQNKYVQEHAQEVFWAAVESVALKDMSPKWKKKTRIVNYDVVTAYSVFAYWCSAGMVSFPKYDSKVEVFIQHCLNSVLLDKNERPAEEREVQHLHQVKKTVPKVLGKNGPIHFLSSALFAFLKCIGNNYEDFSFSEVPEEYMDELEKFDADKVRFTMFDSPVEENKIWVP